MMDIAHSTYTRWDAGTQTYQVRRKCDREVLWRMTETQSAEAARSISNAHNTLRGAAKTYPGPLQPCPQCEE